MVCSAKQQGSKAKLLPVQSQQLHQAAQARDVKMFTFRTMAGGDQKGR